MKKIIVASLTFTAMAACHAQSSVTLYGVADAWLGSTQVKGGGSNPAAPTNNGLTQAVVNSSGWNSSRFGLKGTEDLGGGLQALLQLEGGFNIDTGASRVAGSIFDRKAFVGIQGDFGIVGLGRQYSAYDELHFANAQNYDAATFQATAPVAANGMVDYTNRISNSIKYNSPDINGFSGSVVYGFGENKAAPTHATDSVSMHVKYARGPWLLGYAYQADKTVNAGVNDKNQFNLLGAAYDFGWTRLVFGYNTAKNNLFRDKEVQAGAYFPLGLATVAVGYAHSKSTFGGTSRSGNGFSAIGTYDLSKRAALYVSALRSRAYVLTDTVRTEATSYGIGLRHNF